MDSWFRNYAENVIRQGSVYGTPDKEVRFGLVFFDKNGKPSETKWVETITFTDEESAQLRKEGKELYER